MPSRIVATRLIAGIILINLFVYAMAGLALYQSRLRYEERAALTTQNLARSLAVNVAGVIDKIDVGLFDLATEVEQQLAHGRIDDMALNRYLGGQLRQIRDFEGMWVSDAAGDVHWGTELPPGKPVNIADREYFSRLKTSESPGLVISDPLMGRVTHAWSILLSRRINHPDGRFAGVALGSLRVVDYFNTMFSAIDIGEHGAIGLRNDRLEVVVRYPRLPVDAVPTANSRVSDTAAGMIRASPNAGTFVAPSAQDGIERTFSYQKVAGYPYLIFVGQSTTYFLTPWRREVALSLSMLLCFSVLTLFYSWQSNRRAQEQRATEELARHSARVERHSAELERAMMGTIDAVSKMMELRDPYTSGHERRVGEISAAIAQQMGLDSEVQRGLRVAGGVHDIGKITVPAEILSKPSRISDIEYAIVQNHATQGYEILKDIAFPWPVADVARQHHERLDGSGYPAGLKGDAIGREARIVAVADVLEAMASHRPYRPAIGVDKALTELERGRGTQYDATVVDACLTLFRDKGYVLPP